jgi:hypothetical protein
MPRWKPKPIWEGEDVFIIGGGRSLVRDGFDWNLLRHEHVIGCNTAYVHGPDICDVCIFGDHKWLRHHEKKREFHAYIDRGGFVVTNCSQLQRSVVPWLHIMGRVSRGLDRDALGWNTNTGASAINLALLMGAKNIYLLGFDMQLVDGKPNWHSDLIDKPNPAVYERMMVSFGYVKRSLLDKFPGRQVFNVTKDSKLDTFQKLEFDEFWKERKSHGEFRCRDGASCDDANSVGCGAGSAA